tara:strand:- start:828 stop:1004 length:177 start_codon:yes stop_codon:yes gene_type:complete
MAHYTKDLNEIIKGLKKASKLHAAQAKKLEKINKDQKRLSIVKAPKRKKSIKRNTKRK